MGKKPDIVIVGAGFGGIYTASRLVKKLGKDKANITIINRNNYFLFTPLLHEVATGSLSQQSVVEPVAEIFRGKGVRFIQSDVRKVDLQRKTVEMAGLSLSFDYIVISSGAETNAYKIPGVKENSLMLKTLPDALAIRKRIIESIKTASHTEDQNERKRLLSFIIVGGGPTGVELAAELDEFVFQVSKSYYASAVSAHEISITLVASSADLVPQFSLEVRSKALSVLSKKGVQVLLNTSVTEVTDGGVETNSGFIKAGTVIWVAGVEASLPELNTEVHMHKSGRLMMNEFLQVEGHTDAFALGDAAILPPKEGEPPVPQLAQAAVQEAKVVAHNIVALMKKSNDLVSFKYQSKGMLISLGLWQAAGDLFGMHPSGPAMWFLWRTIYLFKFTPWRKRFSIMSEWTINLFTPRDISEI